MTTFFVSVDLFDPAGPKRMKDGNVYGGETRLFVLADDTLDTALRTLINAVDAQGMRIDRLHKAAPTATFQSDDFPFDVDVAAMSRDARELDEICVTPDYTFSPYGNNETGLFYGLFDYFDPSRGTPYAGEFCHAARKADTCGDALRAVLDDLASDNCRLKAIEDFSDAHFYDPSVTLPAGSLGDLIASTPDGIIWAEGATLYESEDDD